LDENNPIKTWIDTCLVKSNNSKDRVKASDLLKEYNSHPDTEMKLNSTKFCNLMAFNKMKKIKVGGVYFYTNVLLKKGILNEEHYAFEDDPCPPLKEKEL
jgi:hypothetical protein